MSIDKSYKRLFPSRNQLFALDSLDRDLVRDFMFVFSRAEYALKAAGFVNRGGSPDPRIQWDEFAKQIAGHLADPLDADVTRAMRYLSDNPPMKQVFKGSMLKWEARTQGADQAPGVFLIRSVAQVRNNLFHGGKELRGRLAERDRALIEAALVLVAFAVSSHDRVAALFEDIGPRVAA